MDSFAPHKKELQKLCERHQVKTRMLLGRYWELISINPVILILWWILRI